MNDDELIKAIDKARFDHQMKILNRLVKMSYCVSGLAVGFDLFYCGKLFWQWLIK